MSTNFDFSKFRLIPKVWLLGTLDYLNFNLLSQNSDVLYFSEFWLILKVVFYYLIKSDVLSQNLTHLEIQTYHLIILTSENINELELILLII